MTPARCAGAALRASPAAKRGGEAGNRDSARSAPGCDGSLASPTSAEPGAALASMAAAWAASPAVATAASCAKVLHESACTVLPTAHVRAPAQLWKGMTASIRSSSRKRIARTKKSGLGSRVRGFDTKSSKEFYRMRRRGMLWRKRHCATLNPGYSARRAYPTRPLPRTPTRRTGPHGQTGCGHRPRAGPRHRHCPESPCAARPWRARAP